jgi:hypothetical protein
LNQTGEKLSINVYFQSERHGCIGTLQIIMNANELNLGNFPVKYILPVYGFAVSLEIYFFLTSNSRTFQRHGLDSFISKKCKVNK